MTAHISRLQEVDIVDAYINRLERMSDLARKHSITRQAVWKILQKNGIDTKKTGGMQVSCYTCGKEFKKPKCQVRMQKHVFCCEDCYFAFLDAGRGGVYVPSRQGQRIGREKVKKYFDLQESHIVHHEDRNNLNNNEYNLRVFRNQGDHVRYHRGFEVEPIWDGSKL